jgi:hypothetical protein
MVGAGLHSRYAKPSSERFEKILSRLEVTSKTRPQSSHGDFQRFLYEATANSILKDRGQLDKARKGRFLSFEAQIELRGIWLAEERQGLCRPVGFRF